MPECPVLPFENKVPVCASECVHECERTNVHEQVGDRGHCATHAQPHALGNLMRGRHGKHGVNDDVHVGNNAERGGESTKSSKRVQVWVINEIVEEAQ